MRVNFGENQREKNAFVVFSEVTQDHFGSHTTLTLITQRTVRFEIRHLPANNFLNCPLTDIPLSALRNMCSTLVGSNVAN
ncbi:hypothetical protein J6590_031898 [Homalodisca vitripennis]|nr:hypothetical protein J6590_031898 [Homalodisca vitripennis]